MFPCVSLCVCAKKKVCVGGGWRLKTKFIVEEIEKTTRANIMEV